jgi:hypothetical protein
MKYRVSCDESQETSQGSVPGFHANSHAQKRRRKRRIVAGGFDAIVDPGACGAAGADFRRASARQSESRKYVKKANPICVARRAKAAEVSRRCVAR